MPPIQMIQRIRESGVSETVTAVEKSRITVPEAAAWAVVPEAAGRAAEALSPVSSSCIRKRNSWADSLFHGKKGRNKAAVNRCHRRYRAGMDRCLVLSLRASSTTPSRTLTKRLQKRKGTGEITGCHHL